MPRRLQPPSLTEASIMNIVSNFKDYWCAGKSYTTLEDCGQSDTFTPFQYLRDDMIQQIIDMLMKRSVLRSYYFLLLLHANTKRLHLTGCRRCDKNVMKILGSRCQNLTHLKIDLPFERYLEEQCNMFANMAHLTSLDISNTEVNEEVFKVISEKCPNLQELCMRPRDGFCDRVLLYFCNSPTHPKNLPKLRNLLCKVVRKKFWGLGNNVHVCADTVVHLLDSHPNLRHLGIPGIDRAFDQMYGEEFQYLKKVPPKWIHNLLDISICTGSLRKFKPILSVVDRLNLTFQCCPFLTKLSLVDLEDSEILNNLSNLKHLTNLTVHISGSSITPGTPRPGSSIFSTRMFSVLTEIGLNLISLECEGFVEVSLITIGKLCPKLESLTLKKSEFTWEHRLMKDYVNNPFPCFRNMNVINILTYSTFCQETFTFVDEEALSLLFQNATEITEIGLSRVKNLTDKVISSSNKTHSFRHLKKFRLIKCSPISVESVWKLLSADNPLEDLYVVDCENISRNDMELVNQEAKLRQLNVNVIY